MHKVISGVILFLLYAAMFAYTGSGVSPSQVYDTVDPALELLTPTPGQIWYVGQTRQITWTAFDTNLVSDSILIHYSLDGGVSYIPLSGPVGNTGSYGFTIPEPPSDLARVRIIATDQFGNHAQAVNPLVLAAAIPLPAQNLRAWVSGPDALLEWDPVTETVNHDPVTPDGYLLFEAGSAFQDPEEFELLAITPDASYTYVGAAGSWARRFFYVVAYKGTLGMLADMLTESGKGKRSRLGMEEVHSYLKGLRPGGQR